jgi:hypothetical protein
MTYIYAHQSPHHSPLLSLPPSLSHAQIPRVENYLRVLVLLLSCEEIRDSVLENAAAAIKINAEVRGSVRLKVFFRAVLRVGNILNEGTKKR